MRLFHFAIFMFSILCRLKGAVPSQHVYWSYLALPHLTERREVRRGTLVLDWKPLFPHEKAERLELQHFWFSLFLIWFIFGLVISNCAEGWDVSAFLWAWFTEQSLCLTFVQLKRSWTRMCIMLPWQPATTSCYHTFIQKHFDVSFAFFLILIHSQMYECSLMLKKAVYCYFLYPCNTVVKRLSNH